MTGLLRLNIGGIIRVPQRTEEVNFRICIQFAEIFSIAKFYSTYYYIYAASDSAHCYALYSNPQPPRRYAARQFLELKQSETKLVMSHEPWESSAVCWRDGYGLVHFAYTVNGQIFRYSIV